MCGLADPWTGTPKDPVDARVTHGFLGSKERPKVPFERAWAFLSAARADVSVARGSDTEQSVRIQGVE